jgi:hypothetical protein
MPGLEPSLEALGRKGNGIGRGDPNQIEAERPSALDEGTLERLAA